jgi:hypothetical protein
VIKVSLIYRIKGLYNYKSLLSLRSFIDKDNDIIELAN